MVVAAAAARLRQPNGTVNGINSEPWKLSSSRGRGKEATRSQELNLEPPTTTITTAAHHSGINFKGFSYLCVCILLCVPGELMHASIFQFGLEGIFLHCDNKRGKRMDGWMDGCVGCRLIIATTATLSHDVNDVKITQSENPREKRTAAASAAARSRGEKRRRKGNEEMMIGDGGRGGGRGPIFFPLRVLTNRAGVEKPQSLCA